MTARSRCRTWNKRGLFTPTRHRRGSIPVPRPVPGLPEVILHLDRSQGEIMGLHIHAASYFETNHSWPEAIHHYLQADLHPRGRPPDLRYGEDVAGEAGGAGRGMGPSHAAEACARMLGCPCSTARSSACRRVRRGPGPIGRARAFFARKGDRRVEALACLKLSTVLVE